MDQLRILVVGGHPADVFDHCGGTLVHHVRRGDSVTCLALTHGLRVHDVVLQEELRLQERTPDPERLERLMQERARVKHKEVVDACAIFGITDVRFLNYDDIVLLENPQMIQAVARVIREVKPHIVISHHPRINGGVGSHHGEAGKIVLNAVGCASGFDPGDANPGWRTAQLFFMSPEEATFVGSPLGATAGIYCDYYVDVSDVVDLKVRALATMASQQYSADYARKGVECWNGKDGACIGVAYAEGFVRNAPEIGDCLTVSERRLKWANEPEADRRARTDVLAAPFVEVTVGDRPDTLDPAIPNVNLSVGTLSGVPVVFRAGTQSKGAGAGQQGRILRLRSEKAAAPLRMLRRIWNSCARPGPPSGATDSTRGGTFPVERLHRKARTFLPRIARITRIEIGAAINE